MVGGKWRAVNLKQGRFGAIEDRRRRRSRALSATVFRQRNETLKAVGLLYEVD